MKDHKLKKLFQSELIRNSSLLVSGNVIGQSAVLLVYPVLTRIYSEADFGIFSIFMSVTGLLTIICTGRYEESLVIAKNQKEMSLLLGFSFKILCIASLLLFFVLYFFRNPCCSFFHVEAILPYWYFIPPTVFLMGLTFLLLNLATRKKQFKSIATSGIMQNVVGSIIKLIMGLLSLTGMGMIFSNLIGQISSLVPFHRLLKRDIRIAIRGKWSQEKTVGMQYKAFPIYNTGRTFISSFSLNLPILYLADTFGETQLGLYVLAFALLYRPSNLISNSLYSSFFEKTASTSKDNKPVLPTLKKFWKSLCIYILPILVIAYIFAPPAFQIVFGDNWKESGIYFQYLLPWTFVSLFTAPIYFIPIIFNKQHEAFWLEIFYLLFRGGALYIGFYLSDFNLGILLFALVCLVYSIIIFLWYFYLLRTYETKHVHSCTYK